jgi:radical SAM superfamily enzyme
MTCPNRDGRLDSRGCAFCAGGSGDFAEKSCGDIETFNNSKGLDKHFTKTRRIDHIYVHSTNKGKITVKEYNVSLDKLDCGGEKHYPSDHNPVYVDLTIK